MVNKYVVYPINKNALQLYEVNKKNVEEILKLNLKTQLNFENKRKDPYISDTIVAEINSDVFVSLTLIAVLFC